MWRNYWTVAVRALAKSKTYSIINIAGLAIGMAACVMILLYIRYEQSYDRWLPDAENTYELQAWYPHPQDGEPSFMQMSAYVIEDGGLEGLSADRACGLLTRITSRYWSRTARPHATKQWWFADDDFLKVVSLPLLAGGTLTAPETAVITRERRSSALAPTRSSARR